MEAGFIRLGSFVAQTVRLRPRWHHLTERATKGQLRCTII